MTISFGPTVTDQLEKKISDTNTNKESSNNLTFKPKTDTSNLVDDMFGS